MTEARKPESNASATARVSAHLPTLERVALQVVSANGGSVRDAVYVGALALFKAASEWTEATELAFSEYAEIVITSEILRHVHYPVPVLQLPEALAPFRPQLDAMARSIAELRPASAGLMLVTQNAAALRHPYALAPVGLGAPGLEPLAAGEGSSADALGIFKKLGTLFKRHWLLVSAIVVATEVGVAAYTVTAPKTYLAETTLNSGIGSKDPLSGGGDWFTQGTVVANLAELMKSRTVLENTSQALKLEMDLEDLAKRLSVNRMGQTGLLKVEAEAASPEAASDLANAVVREFLRYYAGTQSHSARSNRAFFESQVSQAQNRLRQAEARLKRFKGEHVPEVLTGVPQRVSDMLAARDEAARNLAAAQAGLAAVQRELASIRANPLLSQRIINTEAVVTAGDRLTTLNQNLADAQAIYGANSPVVAELKKQLARAKSQLATTAADATDQNPALAEASARVVELRAEVAMNRARLGSLNKALAGLQPQARRASTSQVTYEQLQREVRIAETQYLDMQTKFSQSNLLAQGAENLNISVVDPAIPPAEPLSAKLGLKLLLGFLLSAGLGLFLSYLLSLRKPGAEADPAARPTGTPRSLLLPGNTPGVA